MSGQASAAVPLAAVKRKNDNDDDRMDEDGASDSGSDVVRLISFSLAV
jgi:hypothetical protein